jgi:anti-sigma factor RsiW
MKNEIEQGLHEKLCAYILGEASEDVRAEVEAALAERAELRTERERIEGTIGLVQATMGESEALPASAAGEILAEAKPRSMRPWYGRASFRMAAGIAGAALVGVIGFRAMEQSSQGTPVPAGDVGRLAKERQAIGRSFE